MIDGHRVETTARLVDHCKAYLVVVPVRDVGGLIEGGALSINGHVGRMGELVRPGDIVSARSDAVAASTFVPEDRALSIAFEDEDLLVCDKPPGMHVHPLGAYREGTLLNGLLWHCGARADAPWGAWRPSPLHRLDRPARGLIAIAKGAVNHERMRRMLESGTIERRYRTSVRGRIAGDGGTIDAPLGRDPACDYRRAIVSRDRGGQHAVTHWTVVARGADRTELEVVLETGRTHQIRVHLASIGHPIVGDTLYETSTPVGGSDAARAIELYAVELRLPHPRTGRELVVRIPEDAISGVLRAPQGPSSG